MAQYLVRKTKVSKYHLWDGKDTLCTMYSTGGLLPDKYKLVPDIPSAPVCTMCANNAKKTHFPFMHKSFKYLTCRQCGLQYQPANWLPWRGAGFCCEDCAEAMSTSIGEREPISLDLPDFSPQSELF